MAQKKIVVGIVGCGIIADVHVEGIQAALKNAEICVCDPLPGKAELLRRKYGLARSYLSLENMLQKEKPFSVHICTPPQYHVPHAIACLKGGCHVFVEKPFSLNVEEAAKAYEIAQEAGHALCVNHSLFFQPCVARMLDQVESWRGAKVTNVSSFFGIDSTGTSPAAMPQNHWKRQLPGGTALDTIIHPITLAVRLTGAPSDISVTYSGSCFQPDELHVMWKGVNGLASVGVSTRARPFRRVTEVTTDQGTVVVDHSTEVTIALDNGAGPKAVRKLQRNLTFGWGMLAGTLRSVWQVARKKLKENPGVRFHIAEYYQRLLANGIMPVSRDNVLHSTEILSRIQHKLMADAPALDQGLHCNGAVKTPPVRKVFLSGASGLLGSALCECLSRSGRTVRAQVRRSANADLLQGAHLERLYVDFSKGPVDYPALLEGVEEVIHCAHSAGAVTWEQFKTVNIDSSVALYRAARAAGCKTFIFISSVAVYGVRRRNPNVVDEETPTVLGDSPYDFYIKSKTLAERALLELSHEGGPKLLIIRPGILYSADGKRLLKRAVPLKHHRLVLAFGSGQNHLPYTRVDMVAKTICGTLEKDPFPTGIYQLAGDSDETAREFLVKRAEGLGMPCRFVNLPVLPLRCAALSLETLHLLLFRKRPPKLTRYILDSSTRDLRYDCSKAKRDLGWDPSEAVKL